jgi:hypothetical protein
MKNVKRIALFLLACFVAFAPPGTVIFGVILILSVVRNTWVRLGGVLALCLLGVLLVIVRRRSKRAAGRAARPDGA